MRSIILIIIDYLNNFLGTFPIDTTKTRLQVQGQKLDGQFNKIKYRGMIDAFCQIYKQEGFMSLYSGYTTNSD